MWPVLLRRPAPRRGPAEVIHAAYAAHRRDLSRSSPTGLPSEPPAGRPRRHAGRSVAKAWFVYDVLAMSLQMLLAHGRWVRENVGVPLWRQWFEMAWLAVWLPSMPENYYKFEWYRPEARRRARAFLHRYEMKNHVYRLLAPASGAVSLSDKEAFAAHASRCGLPVAKTLATFHDGRFELTADVRPAALHRDLFVKPLDGKGGKGADRLTFLSTPSPGYRSARRSATLPLDGLAAHLEALSARHRYARGALVQARLVNHPSLAALAGEALSTCRFVTILDERGEPEPVIAIFRMAGHHDAIVDNSHAGGMAAPVDMNDGTLGEAAFLRHDGTLTRFARREPAGAQIAGTRLPHWDEVVALALRAHRAFRPWALIGWDIAITPDGPVLVEANDQPCTDGLQRRHRLALGDHRFGELVAHHLTQRSVADGDVRRLRLVASALDAAGVRWWVDHGTLLGLVREGGFLPWDDDLDLSFHRVDHARVVEALVERKAALRARMVVTGRGVKLVPHAAHERILDISSYAEEGADLVKCFVRARRGHAGQARRWRDALHRPFAWVDAQLHGLDRRLWAADRLWPAAVGRPLIALVAWPAIVRERVGTHQESRVPRSLLEQRERRTWFGQALPVPADAEGYLSHRYGTDWSVPRRDWTWWDDDRTVTTEPPA